MNSVRLRQEEKHAQTNHLGGVDRYSARQLCLPAMKKGAPPLVARPTLPRRGHPRRVRDWPALRRRDVYFRDVWSDWMVLAALTLLTGSFTVKIPGLLARISVSDAFVFASVLAFGPSVATVIVAIDSHRRDVLDATGAPLASAVALQRRQRRAFDLDRIARVLLAGWQLHQAKTLPLSAACRTALRAGRPLLPDQQLARCVRT